MSKRSKTTNKVERKEHFPSRLMVDLEEVDDAIMHVACVAIGILHDNAHSVEVVDCKE
ncbi:MAG: hypothetical protein UU10_C0002G0020 [Parcubacteria group bacterium GW2011_GWF1_40_6]|uniref:Uncharacterized protein n=1 Tax=Candidatus Nomurabacteria bacterium GW2011_GWF2_40_12 TaxID=1618776 RepID=A0A0G0R2B0_9BACT|nr:MAG: hypothetical protein UT78_C0001G0047 [Candidatus Nomurabacteria bacterium GW2011_GWF2_40_12]KKR69934.1 MAG: hypothetical protein UU10_C0002G0020 [Parcubacteria group bacterium GW2011_GWF1_40_6]